MILVLRRPNDASSFGLRLPCANMFRFRIGNNNDQQLTNWISVMRRDQMYINVEQQRSSQITIRALNIKYSAACLFPFLFPRNFVFTPSASAQSFCLYVPH